jgi:hypothetical protein
LEVEGFTVSPCYIFEDQQDQAVNLEIKSSNVIEKSNVLNEDCLNMENGAMQLMT